MGNSHHQSHFTKLRNCIHQSHVKTYISLLEKTLINAKAYQEFTVAAIRLVASTGSCVIDADGDSDDDRHALLEGGAEPSPQHLG